MNKFTPTHEIILCDKHGDRRTIPVKLCPDVSGGGPAYTRAEWKTASSADWEFNPLERRGWQGDPPTSAGWTFQGSSSYPDHAVSVRKLPTRAKRAPIAQETGR